MDDLDLPAELRAACQAAGSQRAWAAAHGLSPQYVSDVLAGRRDGGSTILAALGLRRVARIERVEATPTPP